MAGHYEPLLFLSPDEEVDEHDEKPTSKKRHEDWDRIPKEGRARISSYECGDKTAYTSREAAKSAKRLIRDRVHPYLCRHCWYWHVGGTHV